MPLSASDMLSPSGSPYHPGTHEPYTYSDQALSHTVDGFRSIPVLAWDTNPAPTDISQPDLEKTEHSGSEHTTLAGDHSPANAGSNAYGYGQPSPPKLSTFFWEDERTLCYQVNAKGICVTRRQDNDMVNGTKLLNVTGMSRGKRDGILKNELGRVVVKVGAMHLKGVWITFSRAKALAAHYNIDKLISPLLADDPRQFFFDAPPPVSTVRHSGYFYSPPPPPPPPPYYPMLPEQHYQHDTSMVPAPTMSNTHVFLAYENPAHNSAKDDGLVVSHMRMDAEAHSSPFHAYQEPHPPVTSSSVNNRHSFAFSMMGSGYNSLTEYAHHPNGSSSALSGVSVDSAPPTPSAYNQQHPYAVNQLYDTLNHTYAVPLSVSPVPAASVAHPSLSTHDFQHQLQPAPTFYYHANPSGIFGEGKQQR